MTHLLFLEPLVRHGLLIELLLLCAAVVAPFIPGSSKRISPIIAIIACIIGVKATLLGLIFETQGITITQTLIPVSFPWLTLDTGGFLSMLFFVLINLVSIFALWYGIRYVEETVPEKGQGGVHALTAAFILGMLGVTLVHTSAAFLFFWELMSFASFFLVMTSREESSRSAALFYLIMTQVGAAAITLGFAIAFSGQLFATFHHVGGGEDALSPAMALFAGILFFIGFGSKAGLVPLHAWLPKAHPEAPSHISALMSGAMLKVALYGFLLVLIEILPPLPIGYAVAVTFIGLFTAIYGVFNAAIESDAKTLLAWSSVENMGLMFTMLGVMLFSGALGPSWLVPIVFATTLFLAVSHAFFKSGLFLAAGTLIHSTHSRSLEDMGGLAKRMPFFSVCVFLLTLAAGALPPMGTFFGEWAFLRGILNTLAAGTDSHVPLAIALYYVFVLLGMAIVGGMAIFAMMKFFSIAFLGQPRSDAAAKAKAPPLISQTLPIGAALLLVLILGLLPVLLDATTGQHTLVHFAVSGFSDAFVLMLLLVLIALVLSFFARAKEIPGRTHITWDCGQPITPRMEYTATAFSAPVRFFFNFLLRTEKRIDKELLVPEGNPYLFKRSVTIVSRPIFEEYFTEPIGHGAMWIAGKLRRIHDGKLHTALLIMIAVLIISLIALL
jgi:hydrogenase-4 component B